MNFAYMHRLTSGVIRAFITMVLAALPLSPSVVNAQVTMDVPQTPAPMKDQGMNATPLPTPLQDLVPEAERSHPEIAASLHPCNAATNVPKQPSSVPNP